jgi:hypothetical protein
MEVKAEKVDMGFIWEPIPSPRNEISQRDKLSQAEWEHIKSLFPEEKKAEEDLAPEWAKSHMPLLRELLKGELAESMRLCYC